MPVAPHQRSKMDEMHLPTQIPVDEDYVDTAEIDLGDAESAYSIASSRWNFREEHGRYYQDYRSGNYAFPLDDASHLNEKYMQALMLYILDNKHFVAPVRSESLRNILDIGSGQTSVWVEAVADALPECKVTGIDLAGPPNFVYPNLTILPMDITDDPWIFESSDSSDTRFDLVHIRNMFASLSNEQWRRVYEQSFESVFLPALGHTCSSLSKDLAD